MRTAMISRNALDKSTCWPSDGRLPSRICGIAERKYRMRLFCILEARTGSVWISWSMLASVLNRKCGSICACSASIRASSTVRSSCSVSARWLAWLALNSALRLPPATTLIMTETTMNRTNGMGRFRMPATISPRKKTSSSVFHGTTASQSKKRHQSSTISRPRSRSACFVPGGCIAFELLPPSAALSEPEPGRPVFISDAI